MTVEELISILQQYPKNLEVLIDCRNISDAHVELVEDFYVDGSSVINITT